MSRRPLALDVFLVCVALSIASATGAPPAAAQCGAWYLLPAPTRPSPRTEPAMIYDPVRDRTLLFGGSSQNDLWQHTHAGGYTLLTPAGPPPPGSAGPVAIFDPVRDRMLVLSAGSLFGLALGAPPAWIPIATSGTPPPARGDAMYDPVGDRLLVVAFHSDSIKVWALPLAATPTWTTLDAANIPPARSLPSAIYDSKRHRIVVYDAQEYLTDSSVLWELPLSPAVLAWSQLDALGPLPTSRSTAVAIYDPLRDRMFLHGGMTQTGDPRGWGLPDTWAISFKEGTAYMNVSGSTGNFGDRFSHSMIYDSDRDAVTAFGGIDATRFAATYDDTHHLRLGINPHFAARPRPGGTVTWSPNPMAPCQPVGTTVTVTATPAPGWVFLGWSGDASGVTNPLPVVVDRYKVIVADFGPATSVPEPTSAALSLGPVVWEADGRRATVTATLPSAAPAVVDLMDLAGRRVLRHRLGDLSAGTHHVELSLPRPLASGLYLLRLAQADHFATRKFVRTR
jgi:hypothetical protein